MTTPGKPDPMDWCRKQVTVATEQIALVLMREFVTIHLNDFAELLMGDAMFFTCSDDEARRKVRMENIRSNAKIAAAWEKHYADAFATVPAEMRDTVQGMAMSEFAEVRAQLQLVALGLMQKGYVK